MEVKDLEVRIKSIVETNEKNKQDNAKAEWELKNLNEQKTQILNELGLTSEEELLSKEDSLTKELETLIKEAEQIQNPITTEEFGFNVTPNFLG